LLALVLLTGVSTFGVTGTIAYLKYLQALKQNAVNQLSGVRNSKAYQIEVYYRIIHSYVLTLSEDRMFIDAIKAFRTAYRKLNATSVPAGTLVAFREDYLTRFYPEMQKLHLARTRLDYRLEDYLPFTSAALQLQSASSRRTLVLATGAARWKVPGTIANIAACTPNIIAPFEASSKSSGITIYI